MHVLRSFLLLALAGCDAAFGLTREPDAAIDTTPPAPDARTCYGTGLVSVCLLAPPTAPLIISTPQTIDTGSSLCPPYDDPLQPFCVLSGTQIVISDRLRGTGTRPLVLVATDTITITGELDVASKRALSRGTGSEPASCVPIAPVAGGGGPGGTLGGRGGAGGPGSGAGSAARDPAVIAFTPGCSGSGGARTAGATGGNRGEGGGAVALIATSITIGGTINASGGGGTGGVSTGSTIVGGGGGGAGGTIALEAAMIRITSTARLFANGGGGGEGAATAPGMGASGLDPTVATAGARTAGGGGVYTVEGDGGAGAGGAALDGVTGGDGTNAGGGGGGGAGRIVLLGPSTVEVGAIVSPAP